MPFPDNLTELLSCLAPKERKFAKRHWDQLERLHPQFLDPKATEERQWWTWYYQTDPERLKEESSCREWIPTTEYEQESRTPSPEEELLLKEAEASRGDDGPQSLEEAYFAHGVSLLPRIDVLSGIISEERGLGNLSRIQEHGLKTMILIIRKPSMNQDLEEVLISGKININALTRYINRRARKKIITNKTLKKALETIQRRIRSMSTGELGHIRGCENESRSWRKKDRTEPAC